MEDKRLYPLIIKYALISQGEKPIYAENAQTCLDSLMNFKGKITIERIYKDIFGIECTKRDFVELDNSSELLSYVEISCRLLHNC